MIQTFSIIPLSPTAYAESQDAGDGGHHEVHVPWESLGFHAVNLVLLISTIAFFGGKIMKSAIKNRAARIANQPRDTPNTAAA